MDYAGNSNKQREQAKQQNNPVAPPEKKIERVVTGDVVVKKVGLGKKMKGIFFGGEFKSASRYIFADVLLPAARDAVVDAVTKGAERVVWGEGSRRRRPEMRGNVQYYNAGSRAGRNSVMLPQQPPYVVQRRRESNEFLIADKTEAEAVLEQLIEIVDKYQVVSLADLLEILGQPVAIVDNNWGWTYIKSARIRQVREGYILELPTMEEIRG